MYWPNLFFKDILICNVTQLIFDFKHLKDIPSRIIAIQSDVTKICRLVPNDCQQDIEGFKKIINYLRLWLHQNPRYHSKPVKEEQDKNLQGISKPSPRWQYWAPVRKQAADVCLARQVKFPNEKRILENKVIPKKMPNSFNPLGASKGRVISKGTFNLVTSSKKPEPNYCPWSFEPKRVTVTFFWMAPYLRYLLRLPIED